MKKAFAILFFLCAVPAFGQGGIQSNSLRNSDFIYWAKSTFPTTYALGIDTTTAKHLWVQYHLDSTSNAIDRRIADSLLALRSELEGGIDRLTAQVIDIPYYRLIRDDSTEVTIDDTCAAYVRVYAIAQSQRAASDTVASYELRITVQRRGGTLAIKDTTLTIMHEDNPAWNLQCDNSIADTIRIQFKGDVEDTVFIAATVEVERSCGSLPWTPAPPAPGGGFEIRPDSLTWTNIATVVPDSLQPEQLAIYYEQFNSLDSMTRYSESLPDSGNVNISSTGEITIDNNTAGARNDILTFGPYVNIPTAFVSLDVIAHPDSSTGYDNIGVGIAQDANNFIFASYDHVNQLARIQVKLSGSNNFYNSQSRLYYPPFRFAFSNVAGYCSFWYHDGLTWELVTSYSSATLTALDLTTWKGAMTAATPNSSEWRFDSLNIGRYGSVGIRDFNIVTAENGDPYMTGDTIWIAATTAGHIEYTNTMGVWSLDLGTQELRQESILMFERNGGVKLDVAGHIVRYGNDSTRISVSTWGNGFGNPLGIVTKITTDNLLQGVHLISSMDTTIQGRGAPAQGYYDPYTVKIGGTWYHAYTAVDDLSFSGDPFYPCLDSSNGDLYGTTLIGAASDSTNFEGTKILKINSTFYVLAGTDFNYSVWDRYMNPIGTLKTYVSGGTDTQPHPMVFPYGDYQYLLTFDNTKYNGGSFTWGDLIIRRADRYYP